MTMATDKKRLQQWIVEALTELGGSASIVDVCKHIWNSHESDLRDAGDIFFTWQYEMRWAGQYLQKAGKLVKGQPDRGIWTLRKA